MVRVRTMSKLHSWPSSWWRMQQVEKHKNNKTRAGKSKCKTSKFVQSTSCQSMWSRRRTKTRRRCRLSWSEAFWRAYLRRIQISILFCSKGSSQFWLWWLSRGSLLVHRSLPLKALRMPMRRSCSWLRWAASCWNNRKNQASKKRTLTASYFWPSTTKTRPIMPLESKWSRLTKTW